MAEQSVPNLGPAIAKGIKAGMFLKSLRSSMGDQGEGEGK